MMSFFDWCNDADSRDHRLGTTLSATADGHCLLGQNGCFKGLVKSQMQAIGNIAGFLFVCISITATTTVASRLSLW